MLRKNRLHRLEQDKIAHALCLYLNLKGITFVTPGPKKIKTSSQIDTAFTIDQIKIISNNKTGEGCL